MSCAEPDHSTATLVTWIRALRRMLGPMLVLMLAERAALSQSVEPGSKVVFRRMRDSTSVVLGLEEKDPAGRYKLFRYYGPTDTIGGK